MRLHISFVNGFLRSRRISRPSHGVSLTEALSTGRNLETGRNTSCACSYKPAKAVEKSVNLVPLVRALILLNASHEAAEASSLSLFLSEGYRCPGSYVSLPILISERA